MDDTIHHDTNLEQHWWRTIDLLTRVGQACIVLNLDKFQFVERSINFAGFRVSDSLIEPLPKYLDAIREFPSLTSTTEIRSWFGLANQVTNYAQLRNIMAPFKPFLSARCKSLWSPELPFPCLPENSEKMKAWLLERYGASTFNTCPHRPLPCMEGPPIEIFLHKPLTKIFADRTLDEICNSRLFRLKQRTLPWRFDIGHQPGKTNTADAASRHPSHSNSPDMPDTMESELLASICNDAQELGTIPWSLIARETAAEASS